MSQQRDSSVGEARVATQVLNQLLKKGMPYVSHLKVLDVLTLLERFEFRRDEFGDVRDVDDVRAAIRCLNKLLQKDMPYESHAKVVDVVKLLEHYKAEHCKAAAGASADATPASSSQQERKRSAEGKAVGEREVKRTHAGSLGAPANATPASSSQQGKRRSAGGDQARKLATVAVQIYRNRLDLPEKEVRVYQNATMRDVMDVLMPLVQGESEKQLYYRFRRIARRKNSTKRPMEVYSPEDLDRTLVALGIDRKPDLYLEQHEDETFPGLDSHDKSHVFIQIRLWDETHPTTVGDFVVPDATTVRELQDIVAKEIGMRADEMVMVEEESEDLINKFGDQDKTLRELGVITGDVIHVEPFDRDFHLDDRGELVNSLVENYFQDTHEHVEEEQENTGVNLKVESQDGNGVFFQIRRFTPLRMLLDAYCDRQGVDRQSVAFVYDGERIQINSTPDSLNMVDQDVINVRHEAKGSIGVYGIHDGAPGTAFLRGEENATQALAKAILGQFAQPVVQRAKDARAISDCTKPFTFISDRCFVAPDVRRRLMDRLDALHASSPRQDVKLKMTTAELEALAGIESMSMMKEAFAAPIDCIKLRRVESRTTSDAQQVIKFHLDVPSKTMGIPLNDESEYCGSRLVFATPEGMVYARRNAGCATVHDNTVPHGVTPLASGVRYGLFLLAD